MPTPAPGKFIVLDGPDGAGKSTQVAMLSDRLRARGLEVKALREPGGTRAGEAIREILLERGELDLHPRAEALLFQAARAQLVEEVLRPVLALGTWVVCDRFTLSTRVYQGEALEAPEPQRASAAARIEALSEFATQGLRPDLYLILHAPFEQCRARLSARGGGDRMEGKGEAFLARVHAAFSAHASSGAPTGFVGISAQGTPETVAQAIWLAVEPLLPGGA